MHELPDAALHSVVCEVRPYRHVPGTWYGPWTWQPWLMEYVALPGGHLRVQSRDIEIGAFPRPVHTWYVYRPGVSYWHMSERPPRQIEHVWFYFDLRKAWAPLSERPFTLLSDPEERLLPHVRAMWALRQSGEPGAEPVAAAHLQVILAEVARAARGGGAGLPGDPWRITAPGRGWSEESLLKRVDEAAGKLVASGNPPALDEVAAALGMSVSALAHGFRAKTGMTVMSRVRWLRVQEARRRLAEPGASLKQVAARLGFCSPFHLSKLFKDVSGQRVRDFVKQQRV